MIDHDSIHQIAYCEHTGHCAGEEDDVVEMEEEEDVLAEPETKKAAKERRDREV